MPNKGAYTSKADNKKAKKVSKAKKMLKKADQLSTRALYKKLSPKRKKQVKGMAKATTAANRATAAVTIIKSKGQGSLPKKKDMKVTPRSIRKTDEARSADLRNQRKNAKGKRYKK